MNHVPLEHGGQTEPQNKSPVISLQARLRKRVYLYIHCTLMYIVYIILCTCCLGYGCFSWQFNMEMAVFHTTNLIGKTIRESLDDFGRMQIKPRLDE